MNNKTKRSNTSSRRISVRKSPQESVDTATNVIATAIRKKVALHTASKTHKLGKNYVYDVRNRLDRYLSDKAVTKKSYTEFQKLYKQYNAA